ncbi:MAG: hypothetical protein IT285_06795, partial [Bdellovibrionales bacterium]|nr:hypothetical protein [Bdellovibrionales bacterium]
MRFRVSLTALLSVSLGLSLGTPGCVGKNSDTSQWLVLTCRFSDIAELPPDGDRLEELFEGPEGLREYFEQISYGKLVPEF